MTLADPSSGAVDAYSLFINASDDQLTQSVSRLLQAEFVDKVTVDRLSDDFKRYAHSHAQKPTRFGALGVCVLFMRAYEAVEDASLAKEIDEILQYPEVIAFLNRYYGIPEHLNVRSATFIDQGTTSLIFKVAAETVGVAALKLIQPRYFLLKDVTESTRGYKHNFSFEGDPWSPTIYASTDRWILTTLVEGINLEQYCRSYLLRDELISSEQITRIGFIADQLFLALNYYANRTDPVSHLDLSLRNIMVQLDGDEPKGIKLIDFGRNYILDQAVGPQSRRSDYYERSLLFVAPELFDVHETFQPKADLYSVGVILLEMIAGYFLTKDQIGRALIASWQSWPSITRMIEDFLDANPDIRGEFFQFSKRGFDGIRQQMKIEITLLQTVYLPSIAGPTIVTPIWNLFGPAFDHSRQLWRLARELVRLRGKKAAETIYLAMWARVTQIWYYSVLAAVVSLTTADLLYWFGKPEWVQVLKFDHIITDARYLGLIPFDLGHPNEHVWGWLICLSFAFIETKYYLNVFSYLCVLEGPRPLPILAEVALRLTSFSGSIPIAYALFIDPQAWPFCVAIGIAPIVLNNFLLGQLVKNRWLRFRKVFSTEGLVGSEPFIRLFQQWAPQMAVYGLCFLVTGLLLKYGLAKDEYVYALFAILFNYAQISRLVVGRLAPSMRGNLARLTFLAQKLRRIRGKLRTQSASVQPRSVNQTVPDATTA